MHDDRDLEVPRGEVGPALVVRGAEPYRFEPIAPAGEAEPRQAPQQEAEDAPRENADRLMNTDWYVSAM